MNFVQGITVEEFKKNFYGKTRDFSLYDCGDFNLLKVILDGLKVNYISKGKIRTPLFYPTKIWELYQNLQRRKSAQIQIPKNAEPITLVVDLSGRSETEKDGKPQSFYFHRLLETFKKSEYLYVVESFKAANYFHDIDLRNYLSLQYKPLTDREKKVRTDLLGAYQRIRKSALFDIDELVNIKIAIQSFFYQFKIWNELLKSFPSLRTALIEQHYHHEGLALALKLNKIACYEIQHGLIAPSDIFYVFPQEVAAIKGKALFPDKILVYGKYWKDVLLKGGEFMEKNIEVVGDFRPKNNYVVDLEQEKSIKEFVSNSKIILISSQTFISDFFCNYARWLSDLLKTKHPDWKVIIKIHPNEKEKDYSKLQGIPNVMISRSNIHYLFRLASIHISVYSTTLYDALEYDLINFSLENENFRDYTQTIINDRIALTLHQDEDPVQKFAQRMPGTRQVTPTDIYSEFSQQHFKKLFTKQ